MNYFQNRRVLVTGAAGSIGSELCRIIMKHEPYNLVALDQNESDLFELAEEIKVEPVIADIKSNEDLEGIFWAYKPEFVIHAAAYKHVPLMEDHIDQAVKTNILGTMNVIKHSKLHDVDKMIFISTDKAVYPDCVMGLTKKLGEIACLKAGYSVVRFGNVLASRGSVIPIWLKQIEEGKPITITHPEMKRYFMTIERACKLVLEAVKQSQGGEIFILDMGDQLKINEIADMIIKKTGKQISKNFIGIRDGEKFEEVLMTEEEKSRAKKVGDLWVIK